VDDVLPYVSDLPFTAVVHISCLAIVKHNVSLALELRKSLCRHKHHVNGALVRETSSHFESYDSQNIGKVDFLKACPKIRLSFIAIFLLTVSHFKTGKWCKVPLVVVSVALNDVRKTAIEFTMAKLHANECCSTGSGFLKFV
jgi:hypothetical protein